jgi:hypothetical protein
MSYSILSGTEGIRSMIVPTAGATRNFSIDGSASGPFTFWHVRRDGFLRTIGAISVGAVSAGTAEIWVERSPGDLVSFVNAWGNSGAGALQLSTGNDVLVASAGVNQFKVFANDVIRVRIAATGGFANGGNYVIATLGLQMNY